MTKLLKTIRIKAFILALKLKGREIDTSCPVWEYRDKKTGRFQYIFCTGSVPLKALALLLAAVSVPLLAQEAPPPANFAFAGVALNQYATPQINGLASYARLITPAAGGVYSITSWDVTSSKHSPYTVQTSVRTGFAWVLKQLGPFTLLGYGDAGGASSVTGSSIATSGGGIGALRIGKTKWAAVAAVRVLHTNRGTQQVYEIGIGRCY